MPKHGARIKLPAEGDRKPRKWATYSAPPMGWHIWTGFPWRRGSTNSFIGQEMIDDPLTYAALYAQLQAPRRNQPGHPPR